MNKSLRYSFLLMLGACIWGAAFVAQRTGMNYVGPFTFNAIRNVLGALVLFPFIKFLDRKKPEKEKSFFDKELLTGGIIAGIFLFLASGCQQIALKTSDAGKAGFITALYIVLVPIFSLILRKKPGKLILISVAFATLGLYLLCVKEGEGLSLAGDDAYLIACAVLFACQIMAIDHFAPKVDCVKLSFWQFVVSALLSLLPMISEHPTVPAVIDAWLPLAYAGFLSSGVAYTLQVIGQKHVKASVASLVMSLESVFSVIFGFLLLHERMTVRETLGCFIMFAAIIFAQITPAGEEKEPSQ